MFKETKEMKKFFKGRPNHTITGYVIYEHGQRERPIYICADRDQAIIAVNRILFLQHYIHYNLWCEHRNLSPNEDSWNLYVEQNILQQDIDKEYDIAKIEYTPEMIASLFRMFSGCVPMGLDFELDEEMDFFDESDPNLTPLQRKIAEAIDQIYKDNEDLISGGQA